MQDCKTGLTEVTTSIVGVVTGEVLEETIILS